MGFARRGPGGMVVGIILIAAGGLLLAENLHIIPPVHLAGLAARYWPLILVLLGVKHLMDGQRRSGVVLLVLGGFFQLLMLGWIDRWELHRFWPVVLIVIGLSMVLRRGRVGGAGSGS